MKQKIFYTTDEEREKIIQEQTSSGLRLELDAIEGIGENTTKYLVFTDEPYIEPQPELSNEEILNQTIAQLTLDNADLKTQLQTLAQTIATMQLGGV
jgi:hypothetical protein